MSIYPLMLRGWDDLSTWGVDSGHFYAQITRNGNSDDDGPDFWITPPEYPAFRTPVDLGHAISRVTGVPPGEVLQAMGAGPGAGP